MTKYAELTDEETADLARYDTFLRGVFSSLASVARTADPEQWNTFAAASVDPVLADLAAGETIPNSTGLAGAKALTREEFLELQAIARNLVDTMQAKRVLLVKAVGVNA